jgi:hypothetical protein
MKGHVSIEHATDARELYRIWSDNQKKAARNRQIHEAIGSALLIAALASQNIDIAITKYVPLLFVMGLISFYTAIKWMIDESNINYLMHEWDLREALTGFRSMPDGSD